MKPIQSGMTASAASPNGQQKSDIPVFLQWDGQTHKYVLLPDHNTQLHQQKLPTLQKQNANQQPTPPKQSVSLPNLRRILQQQQSPPLTQQSLQVQQPHVPAPRYNLVSTTQRDKNRGGSKMHVVRGVYNLFLMFFGLVYYFNCY